MHTKTEERNTGRVDAKPIIGMSAHSGISPQRGDGWHGTSVTSGTCAGGCPGELDSDMRQAAEDPTGDPRRAFSARFLGRCLARPLCSVQFKDLLSLADRSRSERRLWLCRLSFSSAASSLVLDSRPRTPRRRLFTGLRHGNCREGRLCRLRAGVSYDTCRAYRPRRGCCWCRPRR